MSRFPNTKNSVFPPYASSSSGGSTDSGIYDRGLLARYRFEGDATDWAGGYDATTNGTPTYTSSTVKEGSQALDADGTDDEVNPGDLEFPDSYTICIWANPNGFASKGVAIFASNDDIQAQIRYHTDATWQFYHHNGTSWINIGTTASKNTWTHLAITWDGSTFTTYKNGSKVASKSVTSGSSGTGGNHVASGGGARYHNGQLDDARYYSKELTATQINDIYNGNG